MKIVSNSSPLLYRYLIGGAGFVLLIVSSLHAPSAHWAAWILTVFIAFQVNIPLNSLTSEINLSPVLILEAGISSASAGKAIFNRAGCLEKPVKPAPTQSSPKPGWRKLDI